MATRSIGGGGIDVTGIVSQLMTLERRPLQALTQRETQISSRMAAYGRLQGGVAMLQSAAATLARPASFNSLRANVAGEGATAAVTDSSKAVPGTYDLKVSTLATSHALATQAFAAGASVGNGTLTIELGSVSGGTFTRKAGTTPATINLQGFRQTNLSIGTPSNTPTAATVTVAGGSVVPLGSIATDAKAIAAAINASGVAGLSASANATSVAAGASTAYAGATGNVTLTLNGSAISIAATTNAAVNRANAVAAINAQTALTGVTAADTGSGVSLTAADGRNVTTAFSAGATTATMSTFGLANTGITGATVNLSYASPAGVTGDVTFGGAAAALGTQSIPNPDNTLAGLRDVINAAKLGVTASLLNDNSGTRLTVIANDTGVANTIRITTADADTNDTDGSGLSRLSFDPTVPLGAGESTAAGRQMLQTRAPVDAVFSLNGLTLTSSSNSVTSTIDGVSLNLRKASAEAVTTLSIERDMTSVRGAIEGFVKSYNDLDRLLRELTAFDPATRRGAVLSGDSLARSLQNQVRTALRTAISAAPNDFTTLSAVGIEMGRDGVLGINSTRLDAALSDPAKLSRFFTTASSTSAARGFGVQLEAFTKSLTETDGLLPSRTRGLQAQITALDKQQERINSRLEAVEQRLRREYSALDTQLQRMQGTSESLANALRRLPGADSGR